MRDKEIKELDKDYVSHILAGFKNFLCISLSDATISETSEKIELALAKLFLNSTYLEKRLKGVGDIRRLIEKVRAKAELESQRQKVG